MTYCGPVDTFEGTSFGAAWTGSYGTSSVSGGRASIGAAASYSGRTSLTNATLTGAEMLVEINGTVAAGQSWYFLYNSGTGPGWGNEGGTLVTYSNAGTSVIGAYNATTHRWVRIREAAGTMYWDTSPDGVTWTQRRSEATAGHALSGGYIELGSANVATFYDNMNVPPASGTTVTPAAVGRTSTVGAPTASVSRIAAPAVVNRTATVAAPVPLRSATPTPAVVARTATVAAPNVSSGSNVTASPAVVNRTSTVGAPAVTASALPTPVVVGRAAIVVLPDAIISAGPSIAAAAVVRSPATVAAPVVAGADTPLLWPGVLKVYSSGAFHAGRLNYRSTIYHPGQLYVARLGSHLQRRLLDDSTKPHQGLLDGVPEFYDWGLGPRLNPAFNRAVGPNNDWTAATVWGEIYPEAGWVPTGDTQCVVRSMGMAVLSVTTGLWTVLQDVETAAELYGAYYRYDFSGNATGPYALGTNADNHVTGIPGGGFNMHFFPNSRAAIATPGDIGGVVGWFDARVETIPGHADDRASSRFLAGAGGDWWENAAILQEDPSGGGAGTHNGDWSIGRHVFLDSEWKTMTAHTLTERQIRENPPPVPLAG